MAYRDLAETERAQRGRELADALEHLHNEQSDQVSAKKAMRARLDALVAYVARLKTEVRSGKEWIDEQSSLELGG